MRAPAPPPDLVGELGITAVYTSQVARWGGLAGAELFDLPAGRVVFWMTNLVLGLARLFVPRAAPLAPGILHRQAFMDAVLEREGCRALVELACGLSRRGLRFSADPGVQVVEVDRPQVIAVKRQLLARSEEGRAVLARPNHRLVSGDVTELELAELAPGGEGLAVVAEGLLMYLDAGEQRRLWSRVRRLLAARGGGLFLFDLVPPVEQPRSGWQGRVLGRIFERATGGQGFALDDRDRQALCAELRGVGFDSVEAVEPVSVAVAWKLPRPTARSQQLVFLCRVHVQQANPPA